MNYFLLLGKTPKIHFPPHPSPPPTSPAPPKLFGITMGESNIDHKLWSIKRAIGEAFPNLTPHSRVWKLMMMITELPEVRNLRPKPWDVNNSSKSRVKIKTSQNKWHPKTPSSLSRRILYKTEGQKHSRSPPPAWLQPNYDTKGLTRPSLTQLLWLGFFR